MNALLDFIRMHGTKLLGLMGGTIGILAVADPTIVGGPTAIKYFLLAQSVLTFWRGFFNSGAMAIATEVKNDPTNPANPSNRGFARLPLLVLISLLSIGGVIVASLPGCTNTQQAYREASSLDETAYVVAEHYAALVHEAAALKEQATTPPELVSKMQEIAAVGTPAVHKLRQLRDAYINGKSAATQAELQAALDDAVRIVSDFNRAVKSAKLGG
jgi:hypothetical protein